MVQKSPTKKPVNRGWVRHSRRYPARPQRTALTKAGVETIYGTDENETPADLCKGLIGGEHLYVVGTHRLGSTRAEYSATLDHCRRMRVTIHDLERETVLDASALVAAAAMVADDLREINGEARMASGVLGAKRRDYTNVGRKVKPGALSKEGCRAVWFDLVKVATDDEAAAICGVDRTTLWRWFKASGRKAGWPQRNKT